MEPGQLAVDVGILRPELDRTVERGDRLARLALGLERRGELDPGLRVFRTFLGRVARVRDRLRGRPTAIAEDVADAHAPRADAEQHEAEPEDEREEHKHPLRVAAQPREEHRVLDRRGRRGAARRYRSMRLRALRAALLESGHAVVPRR